MKLHYIPGAGAQEERGQGVKDPFVCLRRIRLTRPQRSRAASF